MNAKRWAAGVRCMAVFGLLLAAALSRAAGPLYLWEIEGPASGSGPAGYLFGTVHVCDRACFPLPDAVQQALAASDSLGLELDPEDPELGRRLMAAALLPAGRRLDEGLPAELRPRLQAVADRLGLPRPVLQRMQPWMVSTLLTLRAAEGAGFVTDQGVDVWLARAARQRGLPLRPLETVERQIAALSAGGDAAQAAGLAEAVELIERGEAGAYFRDLIEAWRSGDVDAVDGIMKDGAADPALAPMMAEVLDQRNREMAETLQARLRAGGRPFIAVGAAHFGGESGLLAELARRGFRLHQVQAGP